MSRILRRVGIASAIAIAAVLLWFRRIDFGTLHRRVPTVSVLVALEDIPVGAEIDARSVAVSQWPVGTAPAGVYTRPDSVVGRVSRVPIFKGEPIVPGRLAPEGSGFWHGQSVTPGKQAYSFRVGDAGSLAGMIEPNSRVDVLVAVNDPETGRQVAKVFMSNVRVLAVSQSPPSAGGNRQVVATVEVSLDEAAELAAAAAQGTLQLLLRGYGDPDSLGGRFESPMAVRPRPNRDRMPVYKPTWPRDRLRTRDTTAVRP